ncbi:MAG: hypothetical protein AUJ85_06960 [Elusimicrobia bacterium CG1_02_37_114]|nr:MAG: hypothetical protein AUJ85_06960 [Elusimicrobia bacterium CG1_02_37_114]
MLIYTNKDKMKLIKGLESYRLKNKLSQRKLGEIVGVHYTTINEWERGKRKPNKIQTYNIMEFLKKHKID